MAQKYVIVSTDDLSVASLSLLKYWDWLKERHTGLKLSAFVVPLWWGRKENDVYRSVRFRQEMEKRPWISVCQHGYNHLKNPAPECQRFLGKQYGMIRRGLRKIARFMPKDVWIFKAPFYRISEPTFGLLQKMGFTAVIHWNQVVMLKDLKKPLPPFKVVSSHSNLDESNPDDVRFIHKKLDKELLELEDEGYQYATFAELIKKCLA